MSKSNSRLAGFYRRTMTERSLTIASREELSNAGRIYIAAGGGLPAHLADRMSENVIGTFGLPLSVALNFSINGKDHLIPMAVEEPSVVAAASFAAKLVRDSGGFTAGADAAIMTAQIQFDGVRNAEQATRSIEANAPKLLAIADAAIPGIVGRGGGCRSIEVRDLGGPEAFMVVHVYVDVVSAMGANVADSVAEAIAPALGEFVDGRLGLRILSNLPLQRMAWAKARITGATLSADERRGIALASRFAEVDSLRAVTHNKGVMNGIDAMALALGQDWRAIEAGAHAYAATRGSYQPLATWREDGDALCGEIAMPLAVGTVGGAFSVHPGARAALELSGVENARELAGVMLAVGLASNLAALRALANEGIQKGHMRLHQRRLQRTEADSAERTERKLAEGAM